MRPRLWRLRLRSPLRVFDQLTATVPARVILPPPVAGAVLGDLRRPTGGTGHLYRQGADSLVIAMAAPSFPLFRT